MTWLNLSAFVVGGLVRLIKSDRFDQILASYNLPMIPTRILPWLSLGLGVLAGVVAALTNHMPWPDAIEQGINSGLVAIAGHELLIESLRNGTELPAREPVVNNIKVVS